VAAELDFAVLRLTVARQPQHRRTVHGIGIEHQLAASAAVDHAHVPCPARVETMIE
jgi:hypothetical protein